MTKYDSLAIIDLTAYLWDKLQAAGLLDPQNYYAEGFDLPLVPVIPSQQEPEFNSGVAGQTYLVYDYEVLPVRTDWWMKHEVATIMINSPRHDEINAIMNFLLDLFGRYDDSAHDIMSDTAILSKDFMFKYATITKISTPTPQKNEGGIQTGLVNILYSYVRVTDAQGRF